MWQSSNRSLKGIVVQKMPTKRFCTQNRHTCVASNGLLLLNGLLFGQHSVLTIRIRTHRRKFVRVSLVQIVGHIWHLTSLTYDCYGRLTEILVADC